MHRRPPHKQHGGLWEFPGGKVDQGETPGFALVRELSEELGIAARIEDLRPAGFAQGPRGDDKGVLVILLYTLRQWEGEAEALEHGGEIAWCLASDVGALDRPPLDITLCEQLFISHAMTEASG